MPLDIRSICPACKENKFKTLFSLPFNSKKMKNFLQSYYKNFSKLNELDKFEYNLLECTNCKFVFQEQIPNYNFSKELYENIIDKNDSLIKKDNFEEKFRRKLSYEVNLIKGIFQRENHKISILDFGAGWGFWLNFFKKKNFDVSGYELSETRINFMKERGIKTISDLDNLKDKFDLIYSEETFEHIPNPRDTLIKLSSLLKKNGFILLRFPSNFLFRYKLNKNYIPKTDCAHPLEHINLLNKKSFKEMIKETNLEIIDLKYKFNPSILNFLKDLKNIIYFDSILFRNKSF